jgi:hypothetical protein
MRPRPPMRALHQNQGAVQFSETKAPNKEAANPCVEHLVSVMQNSFDVGALLINQPCLARASWIASCKRSNSSATCYSN